MTETLVSIRATLTDQWHKLIDVSEAVARIEVKCDSHALALLDIHQDERNQNERLLALELANKYRARTAAVLSSFIALLVSAIVAGALRHFGW